MLTVDTSGVLALLDADEPHHRQVRRLVEDDRGPLIVPAGILGELWYLLAARLGTPAVLALLADLEEGKYQLHCGSDDFGRIGVLLDRYADLGLDAADASVVACAEANHCAVLTIDRRDFDVIARETGLVILPAYA